MLAPNRTTVDTTRPDDTLSAANNRQTFKEDPIPDAACGEVDRSEPAPLIPIAQTAAAVAVGETTGQPEDQMPRAASALSLPTVIDAPLNDEPPPPTSSNTPEDPTPLPKASDAGSGDKLPPPDSHHAKEEPQPEEPVSRADSERAASLSSEREEPGDREPRSADLSSPGQREALTESTTLPRAETAITSVASTDEVGTVEPDRESTPRLPPGSWEALVERAEIRGAKYQRDKEASPHEAWRRYFDLFVLDLLGLPREIKGGRSNQRYFELTWPVDPRASAAVRKMLRDLLQTKHVMYVEPPDEGGYSDGPDTAINRIERAEQGAFDRLKADIHIADSGVDDDGLANYFSLLDLPSCDTIVFDEHIPPKTYLQRFVHSQFLTKATRKGVHHPLLNAALLNVNRIRVDNLDLNHFAAHEKAHPSGAYSVTYVRTPEDGIFIWSRHPGFQSRPFFEGRAELLAGHAMTYLDKKEFGVWTHPRTEKASNPVVRIRPVMYEIDLDRPQGSMPKFGHAVNWALNLELLITSQPVLLDAILYAGRSPEDMRRLRREFDTLQPGLYKLWRDDNSSQPFAARSMAMTEHILTSLYGIDKGDIPRAQFHIEYANRFVDYLLRSRMPQTE